MSDVFLYIYDLSMGLSKLLSQTLVGQHFEGIWHTGVVVYGTEYFFGGEGVCTARPGTLSIGKPMEKKLMGQTNLTEKELQQYMDRLSNGAFKEGVYDLLQYNCNTFSDAVVKYLTGATIPSYITSLPNDFLQTQLGASLKTIIASKSLVHGSQMTKLSSPLDCHHDGGILANICQHVKPALFDEPLIYEFSHNKLPILFEVANDGLNSQWSTTALNLLLELVSPNFKSEKISAEAISLLKFSRWATFKQCEAICEIFRLNIWRFPELLTILLTDPNETLLKLPDALPTRTNKPSQSLLFDIDAAKARLFCNCLAVSEDWDLSQMPFIPLPDLIKLCNRLISYEVDGTTQSSFRSTDHEMTGLALTLNVSLCSLLTEEDALELAVSLFHLADIKKCFKHPGEASYIIQAMYAFIKRFKTIADLAKTLNVQSFISELATQADTVDKESSSCTPSDKTIAKELFSLLA